ncbi:MAG: DinB family protein [Caldilineaceae bacterium]
MAHPLVTQLRFTRSEFVRCLKDVSAQDARQRIEPMNSLSWIVGHLASQEQFLWLERAQDEILSPELYRLVGYGQPATTPPLDEMWHLWSDIAKAADRYLIL